jgi:predicted metal-dependent phosphoesterase TrpH
MRVDLHIHTKSSHDAISSLPAIIKVARRRGLQGIAITEHNRLFDAADLILEDKLKIIPGEEVATREGEIIGLFLRYHIPKGLSPEETASAIKEQEGVVYLPHPWKQGCSHPWSKKGLQTILPLVDVVEVFNGRLLDQEANRLAYQMAIEVGILMGAGSDAHTPWEVGQAFVDMGAFDSPVTFLNSLQNAKIFGYPPSQFGRMIMNRFSRKLLRLLLLTMENHPLFKKLWLPF